MIARDCRSRCPPDGTVCADRRSRDPSGRHRPGRPKKLPDAELVCLAVAQVTLGARSGQHWIGLCYARLGPLFPGLPRQPGGHKRVRAVAPLICRAAVYLARRCPSWAPDLRLLDATGAVRHLPGDGPPQRAGRVGRLRLLRPGFRWY
jgi:hypothetical protein